MGDFNIWENLKKNKKQNNILGGLDIGIKPSKKLKNPLDFGLGSSPKKEIKRDSRRSFTRIQQKELKSRQNNKCKLCRTELSDDNIDYDHVTPWEDGGKTILDNGQAICLKCHREKTRKEKLKKIDKKRSKKKDDDGLFGENIFQL